MDEKSDNFAVVRQILDRLEILQSKFGIWQGATLRALVQRKGQNEWLCVMAAIQLTDQKGIQRVRSSDDVLVEPDLYLMERYVDLYSFKQVVSEVVTKRAFGFGPDHRRSEVKLPINPNDQPVFTPVELLGRANFEPSMVSHTGV